MTMRPLKTRTTPTGKEYYEGVEVKPHKEWVVPQVPTHEETEALTHLLTHPKNKRNRDKAIERARTTAYIKERKINWFGLILLTVGVFSNSWAGFVVMLLGIYELAEHPFGVKAIQ